MYNGMPFNRLLSGISISNISCVNIIKLWIRWIYSMANGYTVILFFQWSNNKKKLVRHFHFHSFIHPHICMHPFCLMCFLCVDVAFLIVLITFNTHCNFISYRFIFLPYVWCMYVCVCVQSIVGLALHFLFAFEIPL